MPPRNDRGQFMRDGGFNINIPHPLTILKYLIFFIILFPWYKMLERRNLLSTVYDRYVAPDCDCPACVCYGPVGPPGPPGSSTPCDSGNPLGPPNG